MEALVNLLVEVAAEEIAAVWGCTLVEPSAPKSNKPVRKTNKAVARPQQKKSTSFEDRVRSEMKKPQSKGKSYKQVAQLVEDQIYLEEWRKEMAAQIAADEADTSIPSIRINNVLLPDGSRGTLWIDRA